MATVAKIGPTDRGRSMTLEEFMNGDFKEGYRYELIDGTLYVAPAADLPEGRVEHWLFRKVQRYSEDRPAVINFVYNKARIFVPGRSGATNPEPDLAAYRDFPLDLPLEDVQWPDVSPLLVGEILSPEDPTKDLVRNVELYLQVPSIKEYWVLDTRQGPSQPRLVVHRRHGQRWRLTEVHFGETYTTKLLPGLELLIDPRK